MAEEAPEKVGQNMSGSKAIMTVGEKLKRERNRLKYNLDDVASATKISKMFLIALENDDIKSLPEGIYTRNFLRSYARFLEMDEDIVTSEFYEQFNLKSHFVTQHEQAKQDELEFKKRRQVFFLMLLVIVVVVGGGVWGTYTYWDAIVGFFQPPANGPVVGRSQVRQGLPDFGENRSEDTSSSDSELSKNTSAKELTAKEKGEEEQPVRVEEDAIADGRRIQGDSTQPTAEEASGSEGHDGVLPQTQSEPDSLSMRAGDGSESRVDELTPTFPLPLSSLAGIQVANNGAVSSLDDVFVILALDPVQVEVVIGEDVLTRRFLQRGDMRVYSFGAYHFIRIEDPSKVALQVGDKVLNPLAQDAQPLSLQFQGKDLFSALQFVYQSQ